MEKMPIGKVVCSVRDSIKNTDFTASMKIGEVVRKVRDNVKNAEFPGDGRVARKGTQIVFNAGSETFSANVKRLNTPPSNDTKVARHGTHIVFTVGQDTYTLALKRVDARAFLSKRKPAQKQTVDLVTDSAVAV